MDEIDVDRPQPEIREPRSVRYELRQIPETGRENVPQRFSIEFFDPDTGEELGRFHEAHGVSSMKQLEEELAAICEAKGWHLAQ